MIAVDTSAIVAILRTEVEAARLRTRLEAAEHALVSTANLLELQLVLAGKKPPVVWGEVEFVLQQYQIVPHPFDEQQLAVARDAVVKYGKRRHKAGLNFGDCFAYALAKVEDLPLLCTGKDFAETDIAIA